MGYIDALNDNELILILENIAPPSSPTCRRPQSRDPTLTHILRITHVCRRLRDLATERCPALWTRFALLASVRAASESWAQELVRRCGGANLHGGWDFPLGCAPTPWHMLHILSYSDRLQSLQLTLPYDAYLHIKPSLRMAPESAKPSEIPTDAATWSQLTMPNLRHLALSLNERYASTPLVAHALPDAIFQSTDLSLLQSLRLSDCWIDINRLKIGSNLTHLSIAPYKRHPNNDSTKTPKIPSTLTEWINILATLPHLVELERFPIYFVPPTLSAPDPIVMRSLLSINIHIRLENLVPFVNSVQLPNCKSITLRVELLKPDTYNLPYHYTLEELTPIKHAIDLYAPRFGTRTYMTLGEWSRSGSTISIFPMPPHTLSGSSDSLCDTSHLPSTPATSASLTSPGLSVELTALSHSSRKPGPRITHPLLSSAWTASSAFHNVEVLVISKLCVMEQSTKDTKFFECIRNNIASLANEQAALKAIYCPRPLPLIRLIVGDVTMVDESVSELKSAMYPWITVVPTK